MAEEERPLPEGPPEAETPKDASPWASVSTPEDAAAASSGRSGEVEERLRREREYEAMRQLWQIYRDSVQPVEHRTHFSHFAARPMTEEEFVARPQVLLLGQYSTGKTTMVKWLTGRDSPYFDVGPNPSTDKFMAVVHGDTERLIRGGAAACLSELPYQGLDVFGASFFKSFGALTMPTDVLKDITLVDTPGVLAGANHRDGRDYNFASVVSWLAERADLVLLSFDPLRCDMADEFKEVLEVLRPHRDKVRCVLNKADTVEATELVRVYGSLLWYLGQVLRTAEVTRVFVSSFWEKEYKHKELSKLFDADKDKILKELRSLPRATLQRRTHFVVQRARTLRAHFKILLFLQSKLPLRVRAWGSDEGTKKWLLEQWDKLFEEAQKYHSLSSGDMPNKAEFLNCLLRMDDLCRKFPKADNEATKALEVLDRVIEKDVPAVNRGVAGVTAAPLCPSKRDLASSGRGGFLMGLFGGSARQRGVGDDDTPTKRRRTSQQ